MKTISLEPLTRVEGHGRVDLLLRENRLAEVRVALLESPRLFEALLLGRSFEEVPSLVCRICAICSSVHRIAAAGALEKALGLAIPFAARLVRELLLLGGLIESHALHLYCLVLPDFYARESILELLQEGNALAREGLELKKLGNRIQDLAGGRTIHPVNVEVGGILRLPTPEALEKLLAELRRWQEQIPHLVEPFFDQKNYPLATPAAGILTAVSGESEFALIGDGLKLSDGRRVPAQEARRLFGECSAAYTNAKHSGEATAPFQAGALARVSLAAGVFERFALPEGIFANNAAQGVELIWAVERSRQLVEALLALDGREELRVATKPAAGIGTEVVEAPRGLLVHHYLLDDLGRVVAADILTPTAINQLAMERQIRLDLADTPEVETMKQRVQCIVRAFDPCISCAVHMLEIG